MAAYFEIKDSYIGNDYIKVRVYGLTIGDSVRVFCRLKEDTADVSWDETGTYSGSKDYYLEAIYNLDPGTEYLVNVQINNSGVWLGAQEVTTEGEAATTYTITLDKQGGSGGTSSVAVQIGADVPDISPPSKTGYVFVGYFTQTQEDATHQIVQYYDADGNGLIEWNYEGDITIYAHWRTQGEGGLVWINGNWYQPYIYDGSQWRPAEAYVYYNGWKTTAES